MLGAIIGDIVGSRFEFNNHRSKEFDLFTEGCFVTDDSIMTLAVAKAIMEAIKAEKSSNRGYEHDFHTCLSDLTVKYMQEIGRKYPNCGYGGMFYKWIFSNDPNPYNSFGNGAAMRVSSVGFVAQSEWDAEHLAETVTAVTHNHDEGIKGATATAVAIYMARNGALKSEIRERITRDYYPLDFKIDDIRATYRFSGTCQETVPQAIECFLESTSFEDSIRTAISLGGDSDTIAAITGAIAEAYYGVPKDIKEKALAYLDEELRTIYDEWTAFAPPSGERFKVLTKYIGRLTAVDMDGRRHIEYDEIAEEVFREFYADTEQFLKANYPERCAEYGFFDYASVLREVNLDETEVAKGKLSDLNSLCVLAIIQRELISGNRWNSDPKDSFKEPKFEKWLKRLRDIDWQQKPRNITEVELKPGGFGGYDTYRLFLMDDSVAFSTTIQNYGEAETHLEAEAAERLRRDLAAIHFEYWLPEYLQQGRLRACDGEQWGLTVAYDDGTVISCNGDNTYPDNWNALLTVFGINDEDDEESEEEAKSEEEVEGEEPTDDPRGSVVILFPDYENLKASVEKLRTELSMLVLERDELLYVECKNIEMVYMLTIGGLEYKAYEIECAILRIKRKCELIQAKKNRQEKIVLSKIEELLDIEFAEYQAKLNEQLGKMNAALERNRSESLSEEETHELKKLYRAIVKSLHPDINPDLSEAKIQLFHNAVAAYENGDINGLRIISAIVAELALPEVKPDAISQLMKEKERLSKLLQIVKDRIAEIKSEYPYTMKSLIQSSERTEARKAELKADIEQLNETLSAYKARIEEMLR